MTVGMDLVCSYAGGWYVPMLGGGYVGYSIYNHKDFRLLLQEQIHFVTSTSFTLQVEMHRFMVSALVVLFLAVASVHLLHTTRRPSFIGCVDSSECSEQQCCALGT